MITIEDLKEAIAVCQREKDPNANTCIKLAAYYTILDHLQEEQKPESMTGYSYEGPPNEADITIDLDSGTEFSEAIKGQDLYRVLEIMDEAMDAIKVLQPRLYAATLRKLNDF